MSQAQSSTSQPPVSATFAGLPTLSILVPAYNSLPAVYRLLASLMPSVNHERTRVIVSHDRDRAVAGADQVLELGA